MKRRLIVLDERWDSALTYFGFEVAKLLDGEKACAVVKNSPADRLCEGENIKTFYIEDPRKGLHSAFSSFISLGKILTGYKPDTVVTIRGDETFFSCLFKLPGRKYKIVRIYGENKKTSRNPLNTFIYKRCIDAIIFSSKSIQSYAFSNNSLIINGIVNTDKYTFSRHGREKVRRELNIGDNDILLGVIGRFDNVKGYDVFIKALGMLKNKGFSVTGLVVGEEKGLKKTDIIRMAESEGVTDILKVLAGRRNDIVDILCAIDIGVIPSVDSEVIARVLLEFMSVGRPVVASKVGVMPEIVRNDFGRLFDAGDYIGLSECIEDLINSDISACGETSKKVAAEFYSEKINRSVINSFMERMDL